VNLDFDFNSIRITEFGVGRDDGDAQSFCCVAVDGDVQAALHEVAVATWDAMRKLSEAPPMYDPSEKYANPEYVQLPLDHDLAGRMRELHQATNLPMDITALSNPAIIFCYFARMIDKQGQHLTALRRATQFKGILKSRLIRLVTDALKLIEDCVFKLDNDFDLLVDADHVHILRPSGFEFSGKLQDAVLAAVPQNINVIQRDLPFVEFSGIQDYASKHPRAARYLASIRTQKETQSIDKAALKKLCKDTGVEIREAKDRITVQEGHVMGFLEVLDRRRYELELVRGSPERFRATSRRKIDS
jgi:Domain of unknown function (DUF4868)